MDLQKELLKKETLPQTNRIIKWVGKNEERFSELANLFFKGDYKTIQNAGWPVSYCIRTHAFLAKPYFKKFIDALGSENVHPTAKRNIVRLLQFVETPKRYHGKLMDLCFRFISTPEEAIAVKAFSLTILNNLSVQYPEILPELKTIIETRWEFETPAFKSRAKKILNKGTVDR
jgi:hypothetical protein